jgi:predicted DNA-binding transcriptional regulator AlpA
MPKAQNFSDTTLERLSDAQSGLASDQSRNGASRLLDEYAVAAWLSISVRTLRNWRVQGGQIPFIRVGKKAVRYRSSDVEVWLVSRVRTSTTDDVKE